MFYEIGPKLFNMIVKVHFCVVTKGFACFKWSYGPKIVKSTQPEITRINILPKTVSSAALSSKELENVYC